MDSQGATALTGPVGRNGDAARRTVQSVAEDPELFDVATGLLKLGRWT